MKGKIKFTPMSFNIYSIQWPITLLPKIYEPYYDFKLVTNNTPFINFI